MTIAHSVGYPTITILAENLNAICVAERAKLFMLTFLSVLSSLSSASELSHLRYIW